MLASACHGNRASVAPQPANTTLDKVWLLESAGPVVPDTSVTFAAATGRTIVLRHASPDDAMFLVLQFPAAKDSLLARDSVQVTIRPTPGKYAFLLTTSDRMASGAQATFSYAMHFRTPGDAVAKYPTPGRFEEQLVPVAIGADNKVELLVGMRPAVDMLRFTVTAPGWYGLAVTR